MPKPIVVPPPLVITQEPLPTPPVIAQEYISIPSVVAKELEDYSIASKPPQHVPIIVYIKDSRPKLTYRNPHAQPHTFTIPIPKQSDTSVFPSNLRCSKRDLQTSNFLTR